MTNRETDKGNSLSLQCRQRIQLRQDKDQCMDAFPAMLPNFLEPGWSSGGPELSWKNWFMPGSHGFEYHFKSLAHSDPPSKHQLKPHLKPRLTQHIRDLCRIRELTTGTAGRLWQRMAGSEWLALVSDACLSYIL